MYSVLYSCTRDVVHITTHNIGASSWRAKGKDFTSKEEKSMELHMQEPNARAK